MTRESDRDELASGYVLGTLSAGQRREVESLLLLDADLRARVQALEAQLLPLTQLAEPVEPSPSLWPRIQASLNFAGTTLKQGWSWWTSLGLWRGLSAGGFATAAILTFVLLTQKPAETRFVVVLAAPQDKSPGWVIQASTNNQLQLIPLQVLEVPADKSLQFWTKVDSWSGPKSLGLVKPGQPLNVALDKLPPLEANQLFEITLEPYNGSPLNRPTGPILHIGRAVKVM
jgi:anti-sigma-K factor RskA